MTDSEIVDRHLESLEEIMEDYVDAPLTEDAVKEILERYRTWWENEETLDEDEGAGRHA